MNQRLESFDGLEAISGSILLRDYLLNVLEVGDQAQLYTPRTATWSSLTLIPEDQTVLWHSVNCQVLGLNLACKFEESEEFEFQDRIEPALWHVMIYDFGVVTTVAAVVAWLSTDHFRWKVPARVPENLTSYGLVKDYPRSIMAFAHFLIGYRNLMFPDQPILAPGDTNREIVEVCTEKTKAYQQLFTTSEIESARQEAWRQAPSFKLS